MGMGMNHWEWERMGLKKDIPACLYSQPYRHFFSDEHHTGMSRVQAIEGQEKHRWFCRI